MDSIIVVTGNYLKMGSSLFCIHKYSCVYSLRLPLFLPVITKNLEIQKQGKRVVLKPYNFVCLKTGVRIKLSPNPMYLSFKKNLQKSV